MNKEDKYKTIARTCVVGNAVRRANVNGRALLDAWIKDSELDESIKDVLLLFSTQYMDGRSKQHIARMLESYGLSDESVDELCGLSCLDWTGDVVCH
jgi:hypothetical protein